MFKKVISIAITMIMLFCSAASAFAAEKPSVSAHSAILMCANNGEILFEKDADSKMLIASTTKIMTAILALEASAVDDKQVEFTGEMISEGSSMYLKTGDVLLLSDLVKGLMAASGNDAANAIAIAVAGSKDAFAEMMNSRADSLGMSKTHFVTPSGLDADEHYSTARDMAVLMSYAMENESFAEIVSQKNISVDFIKPENQRNTYHNHNRLLSSYEHCIGGKTGFTKAAGRCLVSCAEKDGIQLIAVTLNAPNDWNDHAKLFDYGFDSLNTAEFDDTGMTKSIPVVGADSETVTVTARSKASCVVLSTETAEAQRIINAPQFLYAPVKAGEKVGEVLYIINGKTVAKADLVTTFAVECTYKEKNVFKRLWESILSWFE